MAAMDGVFINVIKGAFMRKNIIVAMASLAFLPAVSFAAAPTLGEVLDASGISVTGHVSASYAYSANQVTTFDPATISLAPAGAPGAYTGQSNSFTLNQANLSISKLPAEGFGAAVDVYGGQDAGKLNNFGSGSDFNLHQAYVQYATGGLTVMGGKYSGLAGAEVVSDAANSNVTRSLLFNIQPVTLTGLRGSYKFNDMVTATVGVNNSATGVTQDLNTQKTVEAGVALAPVKGLTINLANYYGNENTSGNDNKGDFSNLFDVVVGYMSG